MKNLILIVDDHYAIRKSFELAFMDMEYKLLTAESGVESIRAIESQNFKLIFLDLKMPGLSGIETFKEIRRIDPDVFIYFITAFHQEFLEDLDLLIKDEQEFELLQKPIDDEKIMTLTQSVLKTSY